MRRNNGVFINISIIYQTIINKDTREMRKPQKNIDDKAMTNYLKLLGIL
jgi:hypothetical protein